MPGYCPLTETWLFCVVHVIRLCCFFFFLVIRFAFHMHQKCEMMGELRTVQLLLFHACAEGSHDTSLVIMFLQFPFAFKLS